MAANPSLEARLKQLEAELANSAKPVTQRFDSGAMSVKFLNCDFCDIL